MAFPTYTYTFTNGSTADATQVNQNYNDILNGVTDTTKDISVNAATVAGAATLNGNVTLGTNSTKTLTVNASLSSSILLGATNTYDIGGATSGLRALYLAGTATNTTKLVSGATSSHTLTLPVAQGGVNTKLYNDGSGNLTWANEQVAAKTANYTATTADDVIKVDGSGGVFTVTLYAVSGNSGRRIKILRTDNTLSNGVTVKGNASENIRGKNTYVMYSQYEWIELFCDGSAWYIDSQYIPNTWTSSTQTPGAVTTPPTLSGGVIYNVFRWAREGSKIHYIIDLKVVNGGGVNGTGAYLWVLPTGATFHSDIQLAATGGNYAGGSILGNGMYVNTGVVNNAEAWIFAYSTTQVFLLLNSGNNLGGAYGGLNNGAGTVAISFEFWAEIAGWEG